MDMMNQGELRALYNAVPQTQDNANLLQMIEGLMRSKNVIKKPFTYSTNFAAANLTAGATVTNQLAIQSDAPFLVQAQAYTADVAAAGQTASSSTYPLVNVLMTNTGSGMQLMNQAVPVTQIFGNGQFPFVLPEPLLLDARTNLQIAATNRDAAQAYNLFLSFIGVKLFAFNG
ncbi:MAG TPA: hypothetical protein VJ577_11415 [Burkholderiaceae bacterium]|nr:hypothetical protein [Burkholderiaceae bacterium]